MSRTCHRSLSLPLLCLLFAAGAARAASLPDQDHSWCGTTRSGLAEKVAIHRDLQRRLALEKRGKGLAPTFPEAVKVGDVAVLVDDGSLIVHPKQVDLDDFGVQYVPQKKGALVVSPSSDAVGEQIGDRIALGDDEARLVSFPKGFRFRFYNKVYTKMFVHSDGNLTFVAPDAAPAARSLDRLIGGPPRIAPLFTDLNPETADANGGVYVLASKTKVVVTWLDVPLFGQNSSRNTFQVALYPNGRITFAFGRLDAQEAVVGVAPGGGGEVRLLDYTADLPTPALKTAVAERFVRSQSVDDLAVAKAFFREFADDYDHLIVFLDFPQGLGGAFAYEFTVKNEIRGIGVGVFDASGQAGSRGRLRSFAQMGTLARYPDDPETDFLSTNNTLDLVAHESGHRWLSFFHFIDENGQRNDSLLGRQLAHWSFCHNTLASNMEGNLYREEGGDRFISIDATEGYSPLDLYAMGLMSAAEVPPFYYVDGCFDRTAAPQIGRTIQGRRVDVTIDQIIAAEGPRVPTTDRAPHTFNMAFVLVTEGGQFPAEGTIAKVDRIRAAWEPYFAQATEGRGAVNTVLKVKPRR